MSAKEQQGRGGRGGQRGGGGGRGGRGGGGRGGRANGNQPQPVEIEKASPKSKSTVHANADFLSESRFSTEKCISEGTRRAMADGFGYDTMTKVQAAAIPIACGGMDVLAKAQTGTGKTLAFLVPAIEVVLRTPPSKNSIAVVILSPTRELAMQIYDECVILAKGHRNVNPLCVYGGTNIGGDRTRLKHAVDILIATPGRLIDHLENTDGFKERLMGSKCLVLDEADRMLEMGFRQEIDKILSYLPTPAQGRQTLLFSATVPVEIVRIAPEVLAGEFLFIDAKTGQVKKTASGGKKTKSDAEQLVADDPLATAAQVEQDYIFHNLDEQINLVFDLLSVEHKEKDHKVIVFFATARLAQLYAEISVAMGLPTLEIHSRKSQAHRQKASDKFKSGTNVTMFSSDVTARGMDYPDVTFVLQVGAPTDTEQYIHRLGRTARAGKKGRGTLLLTRDEKYFLRGLERLPLKEAKRPAPATWRRPPLQALQDVDYQTKACAYAAWLGFYNGMCSRMKWSKEHLVCEANFFATACLLLDSPPELQKKTIGKMGLKGVPGLVIEGQAPPRAQVRHQDPMRDSAPRQQPDRSRGGDFRDDRRSDRFDGRRDDRQDNGRFRDDRPPRRDDRDEPRAQNQRPQKEFVAWRSDLEEPRQSNSREQPRSDRGGRGYDDSNGRSTVPAPRRDESRFYSDSIRLHPRSYGLIIGPRGETLKHIERQARCRVTVPGRNDTTDLVWIEGDNQKDVEYAKTLIYDVLDRQ